MAQYRVRKGEWSESTDWKRLFGDVVYSLPLHKTFHKRSSSILKFIQFLFPWKSITDSHFPF